MGRAALARMRHHPPARLENTDGGDMDRLAVLAVNDIQDFWQRNFAKYLPGEFDPVDTFISYDSTDPGSPIVCEHETYELVNAIVLHPEPPDCVGPRCPCARRNRVLR